MENPTDPNAGTNRTNAVSRDNLMNGLGLEYCGGYGSSLSLVGTLGFWWSSAIIHATHSYGLYVDTSDGILSPQSNSTKYIGRSVRCLLSPLVALVQDLIHCRMYILVSITGN